MTISVGQFARRLFPAVPVPFGPDGAVHVTALERYAAWMAGQLIGGVAVWAHTGRGLRLTDRDAERVLSTWRKALPADRLLIAAAGARPELRGDTDSDSDAAVMDSALVMARRAADLGADALLVHPPVAFRDRTGPDRDQRIRAYHARVAEAGLPMILFYLYEAAGGISYAPELLGDLLRRPEVLGIKVATLDRVMTFQDIARLIQAEAPAKVLITGEDRFLGYSLMCGAQAALIGMAAACTDLQAECLRSFWGRDAGRFLTLSSAVDDLAQHTFLAPMEGYIRRMLWCLVHQGVIPAEAAHDPWGPPLDPSEFDRIGACLARIATLAPEFGSTHG